MTPLIAAILSRWKATAALVAAFPGGLWPDRVDEVADDGQDAASFTVISAPRDWHFGNDGGYEAQVQIDAWLHDYNDAAAKMALITGTFDNVLLTLSSGTNTDVHRLTEPMPSDDLEATNVRGQRGLRHWYVVYSWHVEF